MPQSPRGDSREIGIGAKSDVDNTFVVLEANPSNKALNVQLAANDGVDIGNVDVTSIVLSTDNTASGAIAGINEAVTISSKGSGAVTSQITGTWGATLVIEGTLDDTNWESVSSFSVSNSPITFISFTANDVITTLSGGFSQIRIRANAHSSGTATVTMRASAAEHYIVPSGAFTGDTFTGDERFGIIAGQDGSNIQAITTDASGHLQTDTLSVVPGTGATNLGKAIGNAAGATDTGVAILIPHQGDTVHTTLSEGEYGSPTMSEFQAMHVEPEQHHVIDQMDALTANGGTWAAIDTDTTGVTLSTKHVLGSGSIEFDKVDGDANSGIGGITKALTSVNLGGLSPHDILQTIVYVGDTGELDGGSAFFFLRLGTNSTDYNEWRIDGTEFTAGIWETVALEIGDASFAGQGGDGWDASVVTYIAVGFSFDAVGDTLANIYVDEISFHTNQHVNAAINAEITSSVSSANVNLHKIKGSPTDKGAGNVGNGSQRIVIASNQNFIQLEDVQHSTGDAGIMALAVENEDQADLSTGDKDYTPIAVTKEGNVIVKQEGTITGVGDGVKTVTSAGTDVALASSTTCRKVDIQAQTDNTGVIAVGATGVDATIATGTGIILNPGEVYSLEIDNLADIFIDSSVSGEGVRFTFFT